MLEKLFHITSKNVKCAICDAKAIREHEFQIQIFKEALINSALRLHASALSSRRRQTSA